MEKRELIINFAKLQEYFYINCGVYWDNRKLAQYFCMTENGMRKLLKNAGVKILTKDELAKKYFNPKKFIKNVILHINAGYGKQRSKLIERIREINPEYTQLFCKEMIKRYFAYNKSLGVYVPNNRALRLITEEQNETGNDKLHKGRKKR